MKAYNIRKKTLPEDHPDIASSLNKIGTSYADLGNHQKAIEYRMKAYDIRKKTLPDDHPDIDSSLNNIVKCHAYLRTGEIYLKKYCQIS